MHRLLIALFLFATTAFASDLATLRNDYALHYFDASAHLRLAKYLKEHGQPLEGFYISELARRTRFTDDEFMEAVRVVYRDDHFDNSAEAEKRLKSELGEKTERDPAKIVALADIHLSRGEWKAAEGLLREAMALRPDSYDYVSTLAEVLKRDGREDEAEKLTTQWLAAHPDSLDARRDRIATLSESDEPAALKAIDEALGKYPDDAMLHLQRATMLSRRGDLPAAAAEYERASQLAPDSAWIRGWTGRFYLKQMDDSEKALDHYLAAYFQDPDFYDSEYAESRIRSIAWAQAEAAAQQKLKTGATVTQLLGDANTVIVGHALEAADAEWKPEYFEPVVALLAHIDPSVRYPAASTLAKHVDASFDERLKKLLSSDDLLTRSAAAYVAGERWQTDALPYVAPWFDHPAELLQYDAASIYILHGGETGKAKLKQLLESGRIHNERIRSMITYALNPPPKPDEP